MQLFTDFWNYGAVFLIVLTVVVFVHEFGHFIIALWAGVKIEVFSIGFGPELFGFTTKSGTRWKFSLFMLGGYVKMLGENGMSDLTIPTPEEKAHSFFYKKVYQRAAIVVAGPLSNLVFGIVVLTGLLMSYGGHHVTPAIGHVQENSAAHHAGLLDGDIVHEANGEKINDFQDLQSIVRLNVGEPLLLVIERSGMIQKIIAHPTITETKDIFGNLQKVPMLGIIADSNNIEIIHYNPMQAVLVATKETYKMISSTLVVIGQMLTGQRESNELGGPLRIAKGIGQAAKHGVMSTIHYMILLSINLGLINLFPIPLLDGGHLLFYGVESLLGKPLGSTIQKYGFCIGMTMLVGLMLLAMRNDLIELRVWEFIKNLIF
ncbi:MAG: RIP metalloprotease RseP [Rhodospirillaceae bacterium]|jgi:regulator of sigma E protease|nr:RIP metalloprotease RseP [Rhodospirillaceae bacterium]